jgi:hypothetical protein
MTITAIAAELRLGAKHPAVDDLTQEVIPRTLEGRERILVALPTGVDGPSAGSRVTTFH